MWLANVWHACKFQAQSESCWMTCSTYENTSNFITPTRYILFAVMHGFLLLFLLRQTLGIEAERSARFCCQCHFFAHDQERLLSGGEQACNRSKLSGLLTDYRISWWRKIYNGGCSKDDAQLLWIMDIKSCRVFHMLDLLNTNVKQSNLVSDAASWLKIK